MRKRMLGWISWLVVIILAAFTAVLAAVRVYYLG